MTTEQLLEAVKEHIERLQQAAQLIGGLTTPSKGKGGKGRKRGPMSAAARKKISDAQKKRWAKDKKAE